MSKVVHDLAAQRRRSGVKKTLRHPAGVTLPFEGPSDAELLIPEIREAVHTGTYSADLLRLLPEAIETGDRVLIIGAGLGVVSTKVAGSPDVERLIAVEANTLLVPYLKRVHVLNNVAHVETVNAVLTDGKRGRVPFFARRDLRDSSLLPNEQPWTRVMMVPFMDLGLILTEEQISLVICDIPRSAAHIIAPTGFARVERVLVGCGNDVASFWEDGELCAELTARGYVCGLGSPEQAKPGQSALLFRRSPPKKR